MMIMGKREKFINSGLGFSSEGDGQAPQRKGDVFNLPVAQGSGQWQSHPGRPGLGWFPHYAQLYLQKPRPEQVRSRHPHDRTGTRSSTGRGQARGRPFP